LIRAAEASDIEEIASLQRRVIGVSTPEPVLADWFRRMVFEQPWADPAIPSLVSCKAGAITGFLGSHTRPLQIDGRSGSLACSGQLVVDPAARRGGAGAMLLRTYLKGPQDLTITDGATETVRAIWTRLGGRPLYPQCIEWNKPLRMGATVRATLAAVVNARRRGQEQPGGFGALLYRALAAAPVPRALRREPADALSAQENTTTPLTASSLLELLNGPLGGAKLRLGYEDTESVSWLLDSLAAVSARGELRARLVQDPEGNAIGAFLYYLVKGGFSSTVAILAGTEADAGATLDALFEDARAGGSAMVRGRLEPNLVAPATARGCMLRYVGEALAYASDPQVLALLGTPDSQLTRLDGEWWMGPHMLGAGGPSSTTGGKLLRK
jgi:hypothetical protein